MNKKSIVKSILFIGVIFLIFSTLLSISKNLSGISNRDNSNTTTETSSSFENTTIAFLGDSITYGYVTKQGGQYDDPYPKLVCETLNAKECYNYGVGSSTLSNGENSYKSFLDRYDEMASNIDIIGVMGGTNDWSRNIPLGTIDDIDGSTIYGALNVLANGLKEKYPNAKIFFMSPIPRKETWVNSQGYKVLDVRNAVKQVAESYNFDFLDMYYLSGFENEMNNSSTDGVHPSQELLKSKIAPIISQFIEKNYNK